MQWIIASGEYHGHWCDTTQRSRLEGYGFQFGSVNQEGHARLVGPVTVDQHGWKQVAVIVEVTTLEEMHTLLDSLGVVCVATALHELSGDLPQTFFMTPLRVEAALGRSFMLEELET
jgi:hypothetical protein